MLRAQDPAPRPLWPRASRRSRGRHGAPAFFSGSGGRCTCRGSPSRAPACPEARSPPAAPDAFPALLCGFMPVPLSSAAQTHQRGFQMLRPFTPACPGNDTMLLSRCQVHFLTKELLRASSGSARPEPWGVTTCLERHRLAKTGTTSAGRGGASGKPARWSF